MKQWLLNFELLKNNKSSIKKFNPQKNSQFLRKLDFTKMHILCKISYNMCSIA
jgi:hypothetical protein